MKLLILTATLFGFLGLCSAEETLTEKAQTTVNSAKRATKKGLHRTSESVCGTLTGDNKVQCLAKEVKNRAVEGKDAVKDKASEIKNQMDTEKK